MVRYIASFGKWTLHRSARGADPTLETLEIGYRHLFPDGKTSQSPFGGGTVSQTVRYIDQLGEWSLHLYYS